MTHGDNTSRKYEKFVRVSKGQYFVEECHSQGQTHIVLSGGALSKNFGLCSHGGQSSVTISRDKDPRHQGGAPTDTFVTRALARGSPQSCRQLCRDCISIEVVEGNFIFVMVL